MSENLPDVFVLIRTVGERTEKVCEKLIYQQGISEENLKTVHSVPFSTSLLESYQAGIERGLKWTLCVDADVLLRQGSIAGAVALMEQQSSQVFELQGHVLDKFFGGPREAGFHLYRTSLLEKGVQLMPNGNHIRPETETLNNMQNKGFPFVRAPLLLGVHDFEQYYADIFRKCFVQAHKHLYRSELLITVLKEGVEHDKDLFVGLKGFVEGLFYNGEVMIDAGQQVYKESFRKLQIEEKHEISVKDFDFHWVENIISNWKEPEIFKQYLKYSVRDLELINEISRAIDKNVFAVAGVINYQSLNVNSSDSFHDRQNNESKNNLETPETRCSLKMLVKRIVTCLISFMGNLKNRKTS